MSLSQTISKDERLGTCPVIEESVTPSTQSCVRKSETLKDSKSIYYKKNYISISRKSVHNSVEWKKKTQFFFLDQYSVSGSLVFYFEH